MPNYTIIINGRAVTCERTFDVINPATEQVFAQAPDASKEQLDEAVEAAKKALPKWRDMKRHPILRQCADRLAKHIDELAKLLTQEQGKPLAKAKDEIELTINTFYNAAHTQIPIDVVHEDEHSRVEVHRYPIGVVATILPWNFPVSIGAGRIATALLTGNTIIVKPSPYTPLSTLRLGELLQDIVPPGVLNVISGGDRLGAWITEHTGIQKISFTGSVPTGIKIARAAANDLKRLTLELGGNDACIILPDADPRKIAESVFWSAFMNNGQTCCATKRLYVHKTLFEPMLDALTTIAQNVKVGDGLARDSQLGPLNNKTQLDIVTELVEDARRDDATIVTGGYRLDRPGYFFAPTLVTDIAEGTRLVDEEQFGPVLPMMPFSDTQEVIKRANASNLGLGGSVWCKDWHHGFDVARQLETGTVWINEGINVNRNAPFGGFKHSGIGRTGGHWESDAFSELQTICIAKT